MAYRKKSTRRAKPYRATTKRKARSRPREQVVKLVLQHQMLAPPTAPLMQNNSALPSSKTKQPKL